MTFTIQESNPALTRCDDLEVEELATAIQLVFPINTETAILVWNAVPIQLTRPCGAARWGRVRIQDPVRLVCRAIFSPRAHGTS